MLSSRHFARFLPSLIGLIAFGALAGLWLSGAHATYQHLLTLWGVQPFRFPFVDVDGSLSAWDCARRGIDVIVADPCDVLRRGYTYGPIWMNIDWIPLGRTDLAWVGLALGTTFLASLAALPPPLSRTETMLRIAAVLSTMVVFAVERANPDILIFILVIAMLYLLRRSFFFRLAGYGVAFLAGTLKYYPMVLLGLALRERPRRIIAIVLAVSLGLAYYWYIDGTEIREGLPHIPTGSSFGDMFAAKNFPRGMFLVAYDITNSFTGASWLTLVAKILLFAALVGVMIPLWRGPELPKALYRLDEPRRLALLSGALLLSGCFFAAQNVGYRGIFLLLVLPGLFALGRDKAAGTVAFAARLAAIGIVPLMWAEAIRLWIHFGAIGHFPASGFILVLGQPLDILAWCVREVTWWMLIVYLCTILLGFVVTSPMLTRASWLAPTKRQA